MRKEKIIFFGVLLLGLGCTNTSKEKREPNKVVEIKFEDTNEKYSGQTIHIDSPSVVGIFISNLDYNKYERERAKQEYYNLTDFQGYYSEIIKPLIDSLKIKSSILERKDLRLNFKSKNGDAYIVDIRKIHPKQGLILFNGKNEPIFWKGEESGELDEFVKDYFE